MIRTLSLALVLAACGPYHRAVASVTPGVPPVADCVPHATRCNAATPESCAAVDGVQRWLPSSVEACLHGCVQPDAGIARCALVGEVTP